MFEKSIGRNLLEAQWADHAGYALSVLLGVFIKDARKARASEMYSMRFGAKQCRW
jgi:hypothetical protein